jgi:predicted ArsR family transcriptional regulator
MVAEDVAAALGSKTQLAQFHLDGLLASELIADSLVSGEPPVYLLDTKGRALLAKRGLL